MRKEGETVTGRESIFERLSRESWEGWNTFALLLTQGNFLKHFIVPKNPIQPQSLHLISWRDKRTKNNAIWVLKDAETYYELNLVIYACAFPFALRIFRTTFHCFSSMHHRNNKNISSLVFSCEVNAKVMKMKEKAFSTALNFQQK